jgi:hypothetical protein
LSSRPGPGGSARQSTSGSMRILGLSTEGGSGAAVAEDGCILAAVNELRPTTLAERTSASA